MKKVYQAAIWVMILALALDLVACGGGNSKSGTAAESTVGESSMENAGAAGSETTAVADTASKDTSTETEKAKTDIVEGNSADTGIPLVDTSLTVESILGEWVDISAPDRFAKITKIDSGYQYEDNEGKFTGEFKNGELTLSVSDTETVYVYLDSKTQNLVMIYQGVPTFFKKK